MATAPGNILQHHHIQVCNRGVAMEILIIIGLLKVGVLAVILAGALFIWRLLAEARAIEEEAGQSDYLIWGPVDD